jgi:catechol 2,3-dioxygenase-like lactoylglutathione lyase family enzyme
VPITALGCIGIRSAQLDDREGCATHLLGLRRVDRGEQMRAFRMDDRAQRLVVIGAGEDGLAMIGREVPDAAALDALGARLDAAGVRVLRGSLALADERRVAKLLLFADPAGTRLEGFHGAARADAPFAPARPISGFRTGPLGMRRAVLRWRTPRRSCRSAATCSASMSATAASRLLGSGSSM